MATLLYRLVLGAAHLLSPAFERGDGRIARGLRGRRAANEILSDWANSTRDAARPVVWFHAPSVGEGLQAAAVIDALRRHEPTVQIVYTFFSPSAEEWAETIGAEVVAYLPWDLPGPVAAALEAVSPDALVFTKTEVWPTLAVQARRRGVPVALVGATVPVGAGRLSWPARVVLRRAWRSLTFVGAVGATDHDHLLRLGVRPTALVTTGDPGVDSAAARFGALDRSAPWLAPLLHERPSTFVMGSTWPSDEVVLMPALRALRGRVPELRAIIAPHEPDAGCVSSLVAKLESNGWSSTTLAAVEEAGSVGGADAVVVDRLGVLAHLYGAADVSYVGGAFHDAGVHSVLEPAAAGTPIIIGPRHTNAPAAAELIRVGGAKIARNSDEVADAVAAWLEDPATGKDGGRCAQDYIQGWLGAAEKSAQQITHLLKALPE